MRSFGGWILLTGIAVALFVYLPTPAKKGASLDQLERIVSLGFAGLPGAQVTQATYVSRLSAFSPSIALSMSPRSEPRRAGHETMAGGGQMGWQTIVSASTSANELSPHDPDARLELVLEIKQELRRLGCYRGRLDGSWESATRNAMKELIDRVNATLPIDQPDYVQLTLIQSQPDGLCDACPTGRSLSASEGCRGSAAVAATQKDVLPWKAKMLFKPVLPARNGEPLPGRMAVGGPPPASDDENQRLPPASASTTAKLPPTAIAALETAPFAATAVDQPARGAPKAMRRSGGRRSARNHNRRFAGGPAAQRARSYRRGGPGTPRHNLLLSLGGVY